MWSIRSKVARANDGKKKLMEQRTEEEDGIVIDSLTSERLYPNQRLLRGKVRERGRKKDAEKHSEKSLHINGVLPKRVNYIYIHCITTERKEEEREERMYLGN